VLDQGKLPRTRSVSLSMFMNRWPDTPDSDFDKCWHRLGDVRRPGPAQAQALAFVDEQEKSIQQSVFGRNAPNRFQTFETPIWTWISFPATRHGNAGAVSFADGHAKAWRWREANTLKITSEDSLSLFPKFFLCMKCEIKMRGGQFRSSRAASFDELDRDVGAMPSVPGGRYSMHAIHDPNSFSSLQCDYY
jgi:prepilin-type processing-associated H-X9-DG protein